MAQKKSSKKAEVVEGEAKLECVATPKDYPALKPYIKVLRNKCDPPPVMIDPCKEQQGYELGRCAENAIKYISKHGGEVVKGFKIWKLPYGDRNGQIQMTAQSHCVVKQVDDSYLDVTPPDPGDEGKRILFVPSSRVYPSFAVQDIVRLNELGFEPRMGSVYAPDSWLWLSQLESPLLRKGSADELELLLCPKESDFPFLSFDEMDHFGRASGRTIVEATSFLAPLKQKGAAPLLTA
jgi:hypothetical protein